MSSEQPGDTKYGHLLPDDAEDEPPYPAIDIDGHTVMAEWSPAGGEERFRAHVGHGDFEICPFVSVVDRYHRDDEAETWEPDGAIAWDEVPDPVQERIVDVVDGADRPEDLAATEVSGDVQ